MEVIKVIPRGYCKGVTRAISIARQTALQNPDKKIYVLGMLVHNRYVMQALAEMNIIAVDDKHLTRMELLDKIPNDGIVIFTAHGIAPNVIKKANDKGLICVDASCPDVVKTQHLVQEKLAEGYEILYIGKKAHPEAEAVCSLSERVHLITSIQDIEESDIHAPVFVTNQTTMSIFDMETIFDRIKAKYPNAQICEEICNATRIRQQAVYHLKDDDVDVLYVVGDKHSNNSNRLASIGIDCGIPHVYRIDDVTEIEDVQLHDVKRIAVTAGASTPTYLTTQVIEYLEHYDSGLPKPIVDIQKIL